MLEMYCNESTWIRKVLKVEIDLKYLFIFQRRLRPIETKSGRFQTQTCQVQHAQLS